MSSKKIRGFRLPMHLGVSKDELRPVMGYVYFKDEYMHVTDTKILVKAKISCFSDFTEEENSKYQLTQGANALISRRGNDYGLFPGEWNANYCRKVICKLYKERLIIAGALIAAEIDRLHAIEK